MTTTDEQSLVLSLREFIDASVRMNGGSTAPIKPGHRVKFHWPPHPVSRDFHLSPADWTDTDSFEAHGERFEIEVASTPHGIFGRSNELWLEARGEDRVSLLKSMAKAAQPLFQHQFAINRCLLREGRYTGLVRDLPPEDLLKLLYCEDRDIAHSASVEIETHASMRIFTPALIEILKDGRHPNRRIAQWCVLDLFEDLPSFCSGPQEESRAVDAMAGLLWEASDDYARAIFKAGVVLGGHVPHALGFPALMRGLDAPSRIGRRSAIHGLFHVVEWQPETRAKIVQTLRTHAERESDPQLEEFATLMARDIEAGDYDHIPEPVFADEMES